MIGWLKIAETSGVAEARRRSRRAGSAIGFDPVTVEHVAIVTTEITQNILRHGGGGKILIESFGAPGLERLYIIGVDEGPGIVRLDRMLKDGVTTGTSPGTGLGAIKRLSDRMDVETGPASGTIVAAEFRSRIVRAAEPPDDVGLRLAYPGERKCGDSLATRRTGAQSLYMVCDGLGHGTNAATAALAARTAFLRTRESDPVAILGRIGEALDGTRGAVAAVVRLDRSIGRLDYAAIGNITTIVVQNGHAKRLAVRDGLLGGRPARAHGERIAVESDGVLIMHSDGLATLRKLEDRSALLHRSAPVMAARLLHESTRGRDDVGVLVARMTPARTL